MPSDGIPADVVVVSGLQFRGYELESVTQRRIFRFNGARFKILPTFLIHSKRVHRSSALQHAWNLTHKYFEA